MEILEKKRTPSDMKNVLNGLNNRLETTKNTVNLSIAQ